MAWYSLKKILKYKAIYNLIIGQRSNGKTYAWKSLALDNYFEKGERCAYIRRYENDIKPKNLGQLFNTHDIEKLSKGKWNAVTYEKNGFYMCIKIEGRVVEKSEEPFCDVYALNIWESAKGADRGEVTTICFDEFMTRKAYLTNEFVIFQQVLSSIIRDRDTATIFMLANTVNKYCPYFKEMGLHHVSDMKQGEIELYNYGDSGLTVAVELCATSTNTKKVSKYYAFDNPQLDMITKGTWEVALYPKPPIRTTKEDILKRFYIKFDKQIVAGDIIKTSNYLFILYHMHTGNHEYDENDIVYLDEHDGCINHSVLLSECRTEVHELINSLIRTKREFYSGNAVGEIVRNWKINVNRMSL